MPEAGVSPHDEPAHPVDRAAIVASLNGCRDDLHTLLATASPAQLRRPSNGTKWSNEQLLFHMVFGFLIVRRLLPLVRVVSRMPRWVGRSFAGLLDAGRVPFHWINYAGSCGGALVFNHAWGACATTPSTTSSPASSRHPTRHWVVGCHSRPAGTPTSKRT